MTPAGFYCPHDFQYCASGIFSVDSSVVDDNYSELELGLRPVINIRGDVTISGDGTMESPYTIS